MRTRMMMNALQKRKDAAAAAAAGARSPSPSVSPHFHLLLPPSSCPPSLHLTLPLLPMTVPPPLVALFPLSVYKLIWLLNTWVWCRAARRKDRLPLCCIKSYANMMMHSFCKVCTIISFLFAKLSFYHFFSPRNVAKICSKHHIIGRNWTYIDKSN